MAPVYQISCTITALEHKSAASDQSMSERGQFRGGRGARGGGRGGRGDHSGKDGHAPGTEKKKENILDLNKYIDKQITVKFSGGREG